MKKFNYLFITLLAAVLLVGCKSEKKTPTVNSNVLQPEMRVTSEDTIGVKKLCAQFFNHLKQGDVDGAVAMLNYYEQGEIRALPRPLASKERSVLSMFLGVKYEIDHIIFYKSDDSEVKYTVTLFEKTDPNDYRPNTTSFLIRPIRKGTKWYLTLADKQTDQVKSEIKH